MPFKLSVIILTYNEELYINDAIQSVSFADEIIVLDSYSHDRTPEIVSKLGIKLIPKNTKPQVKNRANGFGIFLKF